jgi:hypothetical protein
MSEREPSEAEVRAALEEQMRRIRVEDVIVQTAVTLVNLAGRRLGLSGDDADVTDLGQARLAIDGARALLPLLPADTSGPVKEALSQLQMAYAREAQHPASQDAQAGEPEQPAGGQQAQEPDRGDAERAKARAKIWTPPGT